MIATFLTLLIGAGGAFTAAPVADLPADPPSSSASPSAQAAATPAVVVSRTRGNDAAEGNHTAPVRTVTRGLALARERGLSLVHIEHGEYGEGESFPLTLHPGVELRGIGSDGTILVAPAGTLLRVTPEDAPTRVTVAGLTLARAEVGIHVATRPFSPEVRQPGGAPVELTLRGVGFAGCRVGVRATPDEGAIAIAGTGVRARACDIGIDLEGTDPMGLALTDSSFEQCRVGLSLRAADGEDIDTYAGPPVAHDVSLTRCSFLACTFAGIERRGAAGTNVGPPYRIDDCLFQGCRIGVELQRPTADTPITLKRTRFHGNSGFGLRVSGHAGDPALASTITDCDFRWNGVGLHATNSAVRVEVRRSRFFDNVGNALFLSNFMSAPVTALVESSIIAGNGGAGVYTMADGERIAASVLHCTIVGNGAGGVHRKTRHSGKSNLEVRGCILAENRPDLERVQPDEVFGSLVADGSAGDAQGNLTGDPGFLDPRVRNLGLRADSICVDAGVPDERLGRLDHAGTARDDKPDLGAMEHLP